LICANLVRIANIKIYDGKIEKSYELASSNIEILNFLKTNGTENQEVNNELSAQHFANLTKDAIKSVSKYQEKPHKVKAYFIKADQETMKKFKKELEDLYERFQSLEDSSADDTYGFISVLSPYK
jgi:flagellar hook-basal body complex protein FliE